MSFAVCGSPLFCMHYSIREKLPAEVLVLTDTSLLLLVIEDTCC